MAMILSTMRGNVRNHIDEATPNYWTNAELNSLIASSELTLWRKIYALRKDYWLAAGGFTLTLAPGQYIYEVADGVPSDIFSVKSIRTTTAGYQSTLWVPSDPNSQVFIDGLQSDSPISNPYQFLYALRNVSSIWVSPLPQAVLTARVDYIQLPTAQSADTDTFLIPDVFLDFVEFDATANALSKGPVGDSVGWAQKAANSWEEIKIALDTPRSDQGPDLVQGFGENGGY